MTDGYIGRARYVVALFPVCNGLVSADVSNRQLKGFSADAPEALLPSFGIYPTDHC